MLLKDFRHFIRPLYCKIIKIKYNIIRYDEAIDSDQLVALMVTKVYFH